MFDIKVLKEFYFDDSLNSYSALFCSLVYGRRLRRIFLLAYIRSDFAEFIRVTSSPRSFSNVSFSNIDSARINLQCTLFGIESFSIYLDEFG